MVGKQGRWKSSWRLGLVIESDIAEASRSCYVYHLFPNVMIAVLSQHTKVVVLELVSIDRTRLVTFALANAGSSGDGQQDAVARDAAFVDQTGAAEDREVTCAIQRAIGSGANRHFTYGRFESAIATSTARSTPRWRGKDERFNTETQRAQRMKSSPTKLGR